jgi:hypothetical protein
MARTERILNGQPGPIPEIRTDGDGITFVMKPLGARRGEQLVIRCDEHGEVWIAIRPASSR